MKEDPAAEFSRQEMEGLLQQLYQLREKCEKLGESLRPGVREELAELAGSELEPMLADPGRAVEGLRSGNPSIRAVALHLLTGRGNPATEHCRIAAEELAFGDYPGRLRVAGFSSMALCFSKADLARLGKPIAHVISEESQPSQVRRTAYWVLARLSGRWLQDVKCFNIKFPEDVVWEFVQEWSLEPEADRHP